MTTPDGLAVEISDVEFSWSLRRGGFRLSVGQIAIDRGERVLMVGPSGSGKSTLLGLICGTLVAQRGRVGVLGQDLASLSGAGRDRFRAEHIGVIFQMFNLLPYLSILDNVLLPLSFARHRRTRAASAAGGAEAEARRMLEALGLDLGALGDSSAAELSVGQQQRVAAARALIGSPEIVVADEPTSALDRDRQEAFLKLLFAEVEREDTTLLMVSHEERFAARFDRTVRLSDVADGVATLAAEHTTDAASMSGTPEPAR